MLNMNKRSLINSDANHPSTIEPAITQSETSNEYSRLTYRICVVFTLLVVILIVSAMAIILTMTTKKTRNITKLATGTTSETQAPLLVTNTITEATVHTSWNQHGTSLTGGMGLGFTLKKLYKPKGIDIDLDDGSVYIADQFNHRIVRRRPNASDGELVAGGNGEGNRTDQLNEPLDVVIDKRKNSLVICDKRNRRLMAWSLRNSSEQQIMISNINCNGVAVDHNGAVYVSDTDKSVVKRWREGESNGSIVAGENGPGSRLNQLNNPSYLVVDQDSSLYVSDTNNQRVMKWVKDAKEGIVVAGGQGQGHNVGQLYNPTGFIVDHLGNVYVSDHMNDRVVRWSKGFREVRIVVGGYGKGYDSHLLNWPEDIAFDRQGNLYVVDHANHRVQRFEVED